jgi:hypothetical protein
MQVTVHVVTITDARQESTQDIAWVERHELPPVTLGLSLTAGKAVLHAWQEVVVEWQREASHRQPRACPQWGKTRRRNGMQHTVIRPVFGGLSDESPRL